VKRFVLNSFFIVALCACKVDPKIIMPTEPVKEIIPEGWPNPIYTFSNNPITESRFQLGRALFYDPILSIDSSVSCANCHQIEAAFANLNHALSHGIKDTNGFELQGTRNTPGLFNLNWHPSFMHDGGINHIEVQPIGPITNTVEMGESIINVVKKLQRSARYRTLFGSDEVNSQNMLKAMAQFMGTMYSYNSKYDRIKRGENKIMFSGRELAGYQLFQANCASCHKEPLFSDFQYRSNGLSVDPGLNDNGREHITGEASDKYKFKTPSLRNVEKTAPYMHDGRYETLEECLNHYTKAFVNLVNIDPTLPANGFQLNEQNKSDIILFLKTLTDTTFINNRRFKDPKYN